MDLIQIGVDPETHKIEILETSPQSRIDRYWTQIEVVLPKELKDYSVRLNFELPVPQKDGSNFYPFFWLTKVPFVTPPAILLAADNQGMPVRVFLTKEEPISGVKESWASLNSVLIPVANARKMEIDDPNWLLDLGYEEAFVKAELDWEAKTVTLTQINGDEVILDYELMLRNGQVSYEVDQGLTDEQKAIARNNIDAVYQKDFDNHLLFAEATYHRLDGANFEWSPFRIYSYNAITRLGNDVFISLANNNRNHDPLEEDSLYWQSFFKIRPESMAKYFVIGDNTHNIFTVTHNFGTRLLFSEIIETEAPHEHVEATVLSTTLNNALIRFANPPKENQYIVVLTPSGGSIQNERYTHEQDIPSTMWRIQHDLGRKVIAAVFDEYGNRFYPDTEQSMEYDNVLVITFLNPRTGTVEVT